MLCEMPKRLVESSSGSAFESDLGSDLESGLDQQANNADLQCLWEAVCNLQSGQVLLESLLSGFCEDGMKEYHSSRFMPYLCRLLRCPNARRGIQMQETVSKWKTSVSKCKTSVSKCKTRYPNARRGVQMQDAVSKCKTPVSKCNSRCPNARSPSIWIPPYD